MLARDEKSNDYAQAWRKEGIIKRRKEHEWREAESQHTLHEFSLVFGELLMPVGLEEAVVPQATRVRQTLDYCIQEALIGR